MKHLEVRYGKYLNKIDTVLPVEHLLLNESSAISRAMEPGEVNLPTPENYTLGIANLTPLGAQRYPFDFWRSVSRQPEEGAFQNLQLYFQIFVNGISQFVGIVKGIHFSLYEAECFIEMGDVADMLTIEDRQMLKAYEFQIPRPLTRTDDEDAGITIDAPGVGYNDLPTLKDINGETVAHESITFQLFVSNWTGSGGSRSGEPQTSNTGQFNLLDREGERVYPFAWHLGWQELDYITPVGSNPGAVLAEQDFPRYVQIGDITLFTRVKLQVIQVRNDANSRSRQEVWCTIWHNAEPVVGGIIPRGRFFYDGELITEETEEMEVIFHEPNFGFDKDIALYSGALPLDKKFIFGLPYTSSGGTIQITSQEYAFFDVLSKITEIINTDVSTRHTDEGLAGYVEITEFEPNPADPDTKAAGTLELVSPPISNENLFIRISKDGISRDTGIFLADAAESKSALFIKAINAINGSPATAEFWEATSLGDFTMEVEAKQSGTAWNGYSIQVFKTSDQPITEPTSKWTGVNTSGGTGGTFVSSGIDLLIGGSVFATSAAVVDSDSLEDIAVKVYNAAVAVGSAVYDFERVGARINLSTELDEIQSLGLNVYSTNIEYEALALSGVFDIFDISRLRDDFRLAFWSDVIMFGWLENSVVEALIGASWQVGAQLFSTGAGKIAIQSRNYYEFFPNDLNDPEFDAIAILNADWEPTSGHNYDEGFESYETEHPIDIIEVNNVISKKKRTIYSDENGARQDPAILNKKIQTGNYRIRDLGVTQGNLLYRYSPEDENWPHPEFDMDAFLPTPRIQLGIVARAFPFPTVTTRFNIFFPDYEDVDVGAYVVAEDKTLWLIKNITLEPTSFIASLEVEFKKPLVDDASGFNEPVSVGEIFEFMQNAANEYIESIEVAEITSSDVTDPES